MLSANNNINVKRLTYFSMEESFFFGYLFLVSEPFDKIFNEVIHLILHALLKVIEIFLDGPLLNQLEKRVEHFVEEVLELVNLSLSLRISSEPQIGEC